MKGNKIIYSVLSAVLLLGTGAVRGVAQEPPPGPPPGPDAVGPGGPMGHRMEMLGFGEMHPGPVVTGAPFSLTAVSESTQSLSDGNTINRTVRINAARDSQGRSRHEFVFPAVGPLESSNQPKSFVKIFDPVSSTAYALHADTKIAEKLPTPPAHKNGGENFEARFEARMQQEIANGTLKKEDLGTQTIAGVSAQGTRYTRTIPAGQMGNTKPIVITSERWYSPDLQIVVKTSRNDPMSGQTSYAVTSIQRTEPAASLFTVPADYTVQAGKPHAHGMGRRGPGGPPPAGGEAAAPVPPGE